ncbi:MAG: recombination-associated protein RdgC [Verrucomicrobiota bacterium]|nr:recombination-associated protein RdgC [Verrucomicrobiota bacterium]
MPLEHGKISFQICRIVEELPENCLELLSKHSGGSLNKLSEEPEIAWVSGRHLLESRIDEETATRSGYPFVSLRKAELKVPASLLQAQCKMEELALMQAEDKDRISRKEKKEIKDSVIESLLPTMPPTISGTQCLIDPTNATLYIASASLNKIETCLKKFKEAVGVEVVPLIPDTIVPDLLEISANSLPLLNFSSARTEESASGDLAQDFLTWLWFFQETHGGTIKVQDQEEFAIVVGDPLRFIGGEESGSEESVLKKGTPTLSPEAQAALEAGKKLNKAGIILAQGEDIWTFSFDAKNFCFAGMSLPDGEELDPESKFQERVLFLRTFQKIILSLFKSFIHKLHDPEKRKKLSEEIKKWTAERSI